MNNQLLNEYIKLKNGMENNFRRYFKNTLKKDEWERVNTFSSSLNKEDNTMSVQVYDSNYKLIKSENIKMIDLNIYNLSHFEEHGGGHCNCEVCESTKSANGSKYKWDHNLYMKKRYKEIEIEYETKFPLTI